MDVTAAWIKIHSTTKSARTKTATGVTNTLDALAPLAAPLAVRWDADADRRAKLRTPEHLKALMDAQRAVNSAHAVAVQAQSQLQTAKAKSGALSGQRRAARAASKAAQAQHATAKRALKSARADYPDTLTSVAVRAHAVHAVPATLTSGVMSLADHDLTVWPVGMSAALIALHVGSLWLGRREAVAEVEEDGASAEERQLMERLDPGYWVQHAPERGLGGTVTTPPALEPGGIRCEVRLDGTWTVKGLREKADSVQALLGARTALRMRITSSSRGGWAVLTLATRSAAADVSGVWTPDRVPADQEVMSLGLDIETGEEVLIPFAERLLISGASGTGKSWSTRPLMATAHLRGDMVLIDGKGEESIPWAGICRCANEPTEIDAVIDEAHAEMVRRKGEMKRKGVSVWDGQQLTVFVDEGQVVLARVMRDKPRLQRLVELSSLGRSRGVVLWWATQYPVTDGGAPGVHNMIAPNLLTRFSLRVATTTQSGVALDDCAHYAPHQIPDGKDYRGHGYLKGYGPRLIRTWTLDDAGVRKLPQSVWRGPASDPDSGGRVLSLVKGAEGAADSAPAVVPAQRAESAPALTESEAKLLAALVAASGPQRHRDLVTATDMAKATVSKGLASLTGRGLVARDGQTYTATSAAGEVSA